MIVTRDELEIRPTQQQTDADRLTEAMIASVLDFP
jgi:hypothetical protein